MRRLQPRPRGRALQTLVTLVLAVAATVALYSQGRGAAPPAPPAVPCTNATSGSLSSTAGAPRSANSTRNSAAGGLGSGAARPLELRSQKQLAKDMMSWRSGRRRPGAGSRPVPVLLNYRQQCAQQLHSTRAKCPFARLFCLPSALRIG